MFNAFQKDENGCVSADELRFVMEHGCSLEKSEIEEIIAYFDMDHDELVSFLGLNLIV